MAGIQMVELKCRQDYQRFHCKQSLINKNQNLVATSTHYIIAVIERKMK